MCVFKWCLISLLILDPTEVLLCLIARIRGDKLSFSCSVEKNCRQQSRCKSCLQEQYDAFSSVFIEFVVGRLFLSFSFASDESELFKTKQPPVRVALV